MIIEDGIEIYREKIGPASAGSAGPAATALSNWSWDNVDYSHLILWSVFGLVLILVMGLKPLLLWPKSPLIARFNDPSISIQQCL